MNAKLASKKSASRVVRASHAKAGGARFAGGLGKIRILIADDHSIVREGLAALLNRQRDMIVVAEASNGRETVDQWKQHQPDIALVDLRMPEMDGVGAIERIRSWDSKARIVVLTTFDGDEDIYRGMRAGAKAYLLKDVRRDELLECIHRVYSGEVFVPPAIAAKLAQRVGGEGLSPREIEVLTLLSNGQSNKEIGASLHISETTVKTHVKSIFTKLRVTSRTEAIATAGRRGFIQL